MPARAPAMSLAPPLTPDAKENAASRILAAKDHYDVLGVGPLWTKSPVEAARRASLLSFVCEEECQKAYNCQSKLICPDGSSTPSIDQATRRLDDAKKILEN